MSKKDALYFIESFDGIYVVSETSNTMTYRMGINFKSRDSVALVKEGEK